MGLTIEKSGKSMGRTWENPGDMGQDKIWHHEKNMGISSVDGGFNICFNGLNVLNPQFSRSYLFFTPIYIYASKYMCQDVNPCAFPTFETMVSGW